MLHFSISPYDKRILFTIKNTNLVACLRAINCSAEPAFLRPKKSPIVAPLGMRALKLLQDFVRLQAVFDFSSCLPLHEKRTRRLSAEERL
jgi:hypothetical protein